MKEVRYLTKSRFKLGLECPTKLFYTKKDGYPDQKLSDSFLASLAEGGFQVGELAKCYFPGGINISELDYKTALDKTKAYMETENVIIYEAAFSYQNLFIRADIVVKEGKNIRIYEVKAKSIDSPQASMVVKTGLPNAEWKPYLCDIAFQKYVVEKALPGYKVNAYLMLADKSAIATVDGLNQRFVLKRNSDGQSIVEIAGDVSLKALGQQILCKVPVDDIISRIFDTPMFDEFLNKSFEDLILHFAEMYQNDTRMQGKLKASCKDCEFKATASEETGGKLNGFKECWTLVNGFSKEDFERPSILEMWNWRGKDTALTEKRFFQSQLTEQDFIPKKVPAPQIGLASYERQILQLQKSNNRDESIYLDTNGLKNVFSTFHYPLHFIDFETTAVAIPFYLGYRPYEQIAFQFSHHIVTEDRKIAHRGQWINAAPGTFPNFEFVRQLKRELGKDEGTIFRYAAHENTILNKIHQQLLASHEPDKQELCSWIRTITKSSSSSIEDWTGPRNMVDLCELVKKYYYAPKTKGSNSIKAILPALLAQSDYLKAKYSKPIYGNEIPSLNFENHAWIQLDQNGDVIDPYKLLPSIFEGIDPELIDELVTSEEGEIADGGAAMMAYAQMQFTHMSSTERELIQQSLLKYCELDTLAMIMIWEEWQHQLSKQ